MTQHRNIPAISGARSDFALACAKSYGVIAAIVCALVCQVAHAQLYNPAADQAPSPYANQLFTLAFSLECQVLKQYNPAVSSCGADTLIRNPTLLAWGFTSPMAPTVTQTRYNPVSIQPLDTQFGIGATFFILAHEAGHHFDLQFVGASVPWASTFSPIPQAAPVLMMSWNRELRADAWAGCAIKRAGMSLLASTQLQQLTASWVGPDIPPYPAELGAINAGYNSC